ncbi:MAG: FAD-dependent oxidoreductase [Thermoleophilaceae bacterium]|nr:FAD-dependent oxidoreductase [Thermoleophilaceae bacterium]
MSTCTSQNPPAVERRRGDTHSRPTRVPVVDAVIVGGGPAGLSAALVLGRARQRVLVLDTGRPANAASNGIGGLLAQTGVAPSDLRRAGREQLAGFPNVEVRDGAVLDAAALAEGYGVKLESGEAVHTRSLVLTHGLRYDPPALPGVEALWGRSVFHCPFCDGWEVRDLSLAVLGSGPDAARSALVVSGWSRDVVLLTDGPARLNGERAALQDAGVRVREERIREVVGSEGWLQRIEFVEGPAEQRDALFVRTNRGQPNGIAAALGCELTAGDTIVTDGDGRTAVPGVYAAGDAATENFRSVANAIGAGSRVAQRVALDLV